MLRQHIPVCALIQEIKPVKILLNLRSVFAIPTCLLFEPTDTAGENPSEQWRWIYNAVTVTQFEVFWDWHALEKEKPDASTLCWDKESRSSLAKSWGCTFCQSRYYSSILRTEVISYNCHNTFLSKLRRFWSLWNLGMLQWYYILLGYGCLNLGFDFSEPKPE